MTGKQKWGDAQDEYIRKYYVSHGRGFCAGMLGFSPNTVGAHAIKLGLRRSAVTQEPTMVMRDLTVQRMKPEPVWPSITQLMTRKAA